jgi:cytidine deaminase
VALLDEVTLRRLRDAAEAARPIHWAPYSDFLVLAAVEHKDGRVWGGSNIEIANYSLSKHAEEVALLTAMHREGRGSLDNLGERRSRRWLKTLYVVGGAPCGSCRQFAWEWADESAAYVIEQIDQEKLKRGPLTSIEPGPTQQGLLSDLLPAAFGPADLGIDEFGRHDPNATETHS